MLMYSERGRVCSDNRKGARYARINRKKVNKKYEMCHSFAADQFKYDLLLLLPTVLHLKPIKNEHNDSNARKQHTKSFNFLSIF